MLLSKKKTTFFLFLNNFIKKKSKLIQILTNFRYFYVFKSKTQSGEKFELSNYIGKPLVIYFYPKDNTPGCTTQACSFRDQYQDFQDLGAEVIGISGDSEESHDKLQYFVYFVCLSV